MISENDNGIYDAMNKGIRACSGDWVLFLGADDRLAGKDTLCEAASILTRSNAQVVVGEALFEDRRTYRLRSRFNPAARNFVHHQAAFYRRALFLTHGGFDISLTVMADYDFNARLWQRQVVFKSIPLHIATCGSGGVSDSGRWSGYREEVTVRHRYFPFARCVVWDAVSVARFIRKKIVRSIDHPHA